MSIATVTTDAADVATVLRSPAKASHVPAGQNVRSFAEAVLPTTKPAAGDQSPLAAMIAAYEARLVTFGETCVLTDEIARVQSGLSYDPTPADKRKHTIAQKAHNVAAQALLDYQPRDAAELATLAQMFTRLDVCEPEDGIEALARMAAGLSGQPNPAGPNPPSGGDVAAMLAQRQEFDGWLLRTDLAQPQMDAAVESMDQMDERIARAPIQTASDAAAKIRLLHHDTTELRHRPEMAMDILAQVAAFLAATDLPPISPDDAELIAMTPEWDRLSAEWEKRNAVCSARLSAAHKEGFALEHAHLTSDQRGDMICEVERRHGVYEPECDRDAIADQMGTLIERARELTASTTQGLGIKVAMCAWYHRADGNDTETDELLRNVGLMVGRPFMMARVDGAEFYTPYQWVQAFLKQAGTFTRAADGKLFMGTPSSPDVEYLEHMKRSVGRLPNADGTTTEPPEGFLDAVWEIVRDEMNEKGADVLYDEQAQWRRAKLVAERLGLPLVAAQ